jgi:hypothetical protein
MLNLIQLVKQLETELAITYKYDCNFTKSKQNNKKNFNKNIQKTFKNVKIHFRINNHW